MRNLPPEATQLLTGGRVVLGALLEWQLSQPVYWSSRAQVINYAGNDYLPGLVQKIPAIKSDFSLSANSMTLTISDVESQLLAEMRSNGYHDSQLDIHLAILHPDTYAVAHVIPSIYRGYCHDIKPTESGTLGVVFKNHMLKFDRVAGRKTNSANQQRYYPHDHVFDDLAGAAGELL